MFKIELEAAVFAADGNQMQVLGKFVHSLTFSNGKSFTWPLVVVKNLTADGFVGRDLIKEAGAITDHSTNSIYFRNSNSDTSVEFEGFSRMPLEAAGQIQEVIHNPRVRFHRFAEKFISFLIKVFKTKQSIVHHC